MKFSNYVKIYSFNDSQILFNTINKSIVKLEKKYFTGDELVDDFPDDYTDVLKKMGYFISDDEAEKLVFESLKKDDKLIISVEVALTCNMRCPYCYQGLDKSGKNRLTDKNISDLKDYFSKALSMFSFSELVLKVLGGEPTISWNTTLKVIKAAFDFCKENNIKLNLMIDTNGVLIEDILKLEYYDSLLLTIPLTHKSCHDHIRKLSGDKGSYDIIVSNLNILHEKRPDTTIVLRHNTDGNNVKLFKDYLSDLKSRLNFIPIIDISYTTEIGGGEYKNSISYKDYLSWKSDESIDDLINCGFYVMATPLNTYVRCQYRSRYSLKLFSDGTVGACAMEFFEKDRTELEKILVDNNTIVNKADDHEKLYQKCIKCKSFFLCGGGYNLPCIKSLGLPQCEPDGAYLINVEKFIKKYLFYKEKGKENLFLGFNKKKAIR